MSEILSKNISYIRSHNALLADKITGLSSFTKEFNINTNLVGEYNLLVNGIPVHSLTGAQNEAKAIIDNLTSDKNGSIQVIFGLGLGYLVDEMITNKKGKIIVYEPDIELLYYVLCVVDFTQNFETKRLFFASTREEISKLYRDIYRFKTQTTLSYLDYYSCRYPQLEEFKTWLKRESELVTVNFNYQIQFMYQFWLYTIARCWDKYSLKSLFDYKDYLKDKPAIIVSAGPSLSKNLDVLKKNIDNAVVFCVGTALKTLYDKDIKPDFLNVIERFNTSQHYELPFTKDICFIGEQFTNTAYMDLPFKERFLTNSQENDDARWFLEKAEKPMVNFETKGTVAYHAIFSAYYLGCNPIILVGQDLAYSDGQCYTKGSKFDGLKCLYNNDLQKYEIVVDDYEKYKQIYTEKTKFDNDTNEQIVKDKLANLNNNLVTVPSQDGGYLPTDAVYATFIDYIQDFAKRYGHERILLNASKGGALIKGFENITLQEAVDKYANKKLDKEFEFNIPSSFDISTVYKNISLDFKLLTEVQDLVIPCIKDVNELAELLKKSTKLDYKITKLFDKLNKVYVKIVNNYMLKYRVVKINLAQEYNNVAYLAREYDSISNIEIANEYLDAYKSFFNFGKDKLAYSLRQLNIVLKEMKKNESCITES